MKILKYLLLPIACIEALAILILFFKLANTKTELRDNEALMAEELKEQLISDAAVKNAFNNKLKSGNVAMVEQIFETQISTNVILLESGAYGSLNTNDSETLKIIRRDMKMWADNK